MANSVARRDSARTQERILKAAEAEFSRKGFAGARVDSIAARAKISKNLLYRYFNSKEDLYIRVLERIYNILRERQGDIQVSGLSPIDAMTLLCRDTFNTFVDEPNIISILNTENLHRGRHINKSPLIRSLYDKLSINLRNVLDYGVKTGEFRDDIDPVDLYISISALGYFYLSNSHTLSLLFNRDLLDAQSIRRRGDHIVDVVISYITAK